MVNAIQKFSQKYQVGEAANISKAMGQRKEVGITKIYKHAGGN